MTNRNCIAIIGLGFVGLPLAMLFVSKGYRVVGIDIDENKIEMLNNRKSYISDLKDYDIKLMFKSGLFTAVSDFKAIKKVTSILICVPTPLRNREPELSYVISAIKQLTPFIQNGQLIVLESSTYPGTTQELLQPLLEHDSRKVGEHFFLGYSPERIDPGNTSLKMSTIPKVISGVTESCLARVKELYSTVFTKVVPVSSPRVAEFSKMLENSQRLINISFINEINVLAERMNINLREVIAACNTKPIGFVPYYPSPGAGGHCIPVDPYFLSWVGMREEVPLNMILLAGQINDRMPYFIVNKLLQEVKNRGLPSHELSVGVIGLTYKRNVNDIRESAALKVIEQLIQRNIIVQVHDPIFTGELPYSIQKFDITPRQLQCFDVVLILVDHEHVSWDVIEKNSKLIIDTRNVLEGFTSQHIIHI